MLQALQTALLQKRQEGGHDNSGNLARQQQQIFPFFRLLKSSLFCRNFSISAFTSTRRTSITSSTVRARLSTGWLNSSHR